MIHRIVKIHKKLIYIKKFTYQKLYVKGLINDQFSQVHKDENI